jgi:hypothetical protein
VTVVYLPSPRAGPGAGDAALFSSAATLTSLRSARCRPHPRGELPDGRVEMQLWCFMQAFGSYICMGGDVMTVGNVIEIRHD